MAGNIFCASLPKTGIGFSSPFF
ncbi:MAG: hypothetical protein JWR09_4456, partial [Mucilaginibacter sp.]|nr:hypothetical protein [Mucilaginibacter sp.]